MSLGEKFSWVELFRFSILSTRLFYVAKTGASFTPPGF